MFSKNPAFCQLMLTKEKVRHLQEQCNKKRLLQAAEPHQRIKDALTRSETLQGTGEAPACTVSTPAHLLAAGFEGPRADGPCPVSAVAVAVAARELDFPTSGTELAFLAAGPCS